MKYADMDLKMPNVVRVRAAMSIFKHCEPIATSLIIGSNINAIHVNIENAYWLVLKICNSAINLRQYTPY